LGEKPVIDTLYIGGGTPTCLDPKQWETLSCLLEDGLSFTRSPEVSVEANPDSLQEGHLAVWKSWRILRISLGIQSFSPAILRWLGRLHDDRKALDALESCRQKGFWVSGDLIFGIPGQDLAAWHKDLQTLVPYVGHVSTYQLTAEPGTPLAGEIFPTQSEGYPFYRFAQWYLIQKGFIQYEVASFARERQWCRHNLTYWRQGNVLALGPSAWGYLDGLRYRNNHDLDEYLGRKGTATAGWSERLSDDGRAREAAILALRTRWGIRWRSFRRHFGDRRTRSIHDILAGLPRDLFIRRQGCIALSPKGFRVANAIWELLV
jgi:oxygen-independent coproporphyrinogen-3 oxidase